MLISSSALRVLRRMKSDHSSLSSVAWSSLVSSRGVGGLLDASWSLESLGSSLLGSWSLWVSVGGVWCVDVRVFVRLLGLPTIALTIRRCVRRSCCLRGSVKVHVSAPYVKVGITVPR
jgi:hypothetical protein